MPDNITGDEWVYIVTVVPMEGYLLHDLAAIMGQANLRVIGQTAPNPKEFEFQVVGRRSHDDRYDILQRVRKLEGVKDVTEVRKAID